MHKKEKVLQVLLQQKMLPLYYHESVEVSAKILEALHNAGIKTIEYTNRGTNALSNFMQLKNIASRNMPDMLLGIGTIKNKEQAQQYIDAGADYIIAPAVNKKVGKLAAHAGLLWIPGCMTPTDIANAENAGAGLVKIFPGNILGPAFITAVKDLFPGMLFMPTGGVDLSEENLRSWFNAGVSAVGMGSKLISKSLLDRQDYDAIERLTRQAIDIIQSIKTNS